MREKPFSKVENRLLHLRHHGSHASEGRSTPEGFGLDGALIAGFDAGTLSSEQEKELAGQVARLLPFHWVQTNTYASEMSQMIDHLGGHSALVKWLDGFPGLPRLAARLYVFMGILDQFSDNQAVVTALREFRERTPYPAGLRGYLVPETDDETLAGIAFRIEKLLGEGETDEASGLALSMADCLQQVAPRAEELDPDVNDLGELMDHSRGDLREAAAQMS
ncbi:hypothetical protein [Streptomyces sp. NPDC098781]|uniref:hypothetical protein n=1 Tax=Streptomyces sp. NPDC098781 TaxID=3366097 RepID=UPI003804D815